MKLSSVLFLSLFNMLFVHICGTQKLTHMLHYRVYTRNITFFNTVYVL